MKESTVPTKTDNQRAVAETREETRTLTPPVDIFETPEGLGVVADLPGVKKDQVDISVENGVLTIKGMASAEEEAEPVYREFRIANYFRQFQLSEEVDQDKIQAEMRNGVLSISLPKKEAAKPRQIQVKVA